jgi:hypothetical protein
MKQFILFLILLLSVQVYASEPIVVSDDCEEMVYIETDVDHFEALDLPEPVPKFCIYIEFFISAELDTQFLKVSGTEVICEKSTYSFIDNRNGKDYIYSQNLNQIVDYIEKRIRNDTELS